MLHKSKVNYKFPQMEQQQKRTVKSRGLLPIYYSTTSGMSKDLSFELQPMLQKNDFISPVFNIGDISPEQILDYEGPVIMILSTYGNGDSPKDGEEFLSFVQKMKKGQHLLEKVKFAILALGNSSFEHFCGHGRKVTEAFLDQGAEMLWQTAKCDANSQTECANKVFEKWSTKVVEVFKSKYDIKQTPVEQLTSGFTVQIKKGKVNWEQQCSTVKNLNKEFSIFYQSHKAEVIHIKQMRIDKENSGRSTLWVRLNIAGGDLQLTPGCNVNVYPQNIIPISQQDQEMLIECQSAKQSTKVPFPPIQLCDLKRIVNFRQKASNKLIKNAILLSQANVEVKEKYKNLLASNKLEDLHMEQVVQDLQPSYEFFCDLGINLARPYTLCSWDPNGTYLDLCVSCVKNGLTSQYLQTRPSHLRINCYQSAFEIPKEPLIMISNGSGIAPFRSIIEYVAQQPKEQRIPLTLFYGIQNEQIDFYFKEDFKRYVTEGLVDLKLAQSRKDPNSKQYVQDLLLCELNQLHEHLFKRNGRVFICGGKEMSKSVNQVIFKAIVMECKVPYKGFTVSKELQKKGVIVEEVFG